MWFAINLNSHFKDVKIQNKSPQAAVAKWLGHWSPQPPPQRMLPTVTRSPLQCLWRDSVTLISTLLLTYWRYQTLPCTPGMNLCLLPPRCADSTQVCWLPQSLLRSATESGQNCSSDSEKLAWHAWAFNWEVLQFLKPFFFTRRYRTHTQYTLCLKNVPSLPG